MPQQVWILIYGDQYDMGLADIKGVYRAPELAHDDFEAYAAKLAVDEEFGTKERSVGEDGSVHLEGTSMRVSLIPSPFTGQLVPPADAAPAERTDRELS